MKGKIAYFQIHNFMDIFGGMVDTCGMFKGNDIMFLTSELEFDTDIKDASGSMKA